MNIQQALEVKKALLTLSDILDIDFQQVASRVCFLDDEKGKILLEASKLWNEFDDAGIVERGAMLGIEITETHAENI